MLHLAVCDDEREIVDLLQKKIINIAGDIVGQIDKYYSGEALLFAFEGKKKLPDILILDIMLKSTNGVDLALKLLKIKPNLGIIFLSGSEEYFVRVYDVEHVYFLTKPVQDEQILKAIKFAAKSLEKSSKKVFTIPSKTGVEQIALDEILTLEKEGRKIILLGSNENTFSFYNKFEEILPKLSEQFLQCHNSYVVNMSNVKSMCGDEFIMKNGSHVPISRARKKRTKELFLQFLERDFSVDEDFTISD